MEAATHRIATPAPATTGSADRLAPPADERALPQLELRGIIGVWAAAALPMVLLAWVAAPLLAILLLLGFLPNLALGVIEPTAQQTLIQTGVTDPVAPLGEEAK